ncbi:MAG: aminotransferase class III-fold pyridoxal phosphate-dependent enzyme, partial [Deltaproteobacteria bacterium]|nr:aminotransferase class III-fold pyridoxal phosphate-dependent enzyme [Deltaproteobacteria bacterium]
MLAQHQIQPARDLSNLQPPRSTSGSECLPKSAESTRDEYFRFVKPGLKSYLQLLGLDVTYHRGRGDRLYYSGHDGQEVEVLDLIGGFGSCLLGHNHPDMTSALVSALNQARPNLTQGSNQAEAGRLASRLCRRLSGATGKSYICTFGNSGADAVDIAMKHCELERTQKLQDLQKALSRQFASLKDKHHRHPVHIEPQALQQASLLQAETIPGSFEDTLKRIEAHNRSVFETPAVFLSLNKAFHGKSVGSLSLTSNPDYRHPFAALLPKAHFLDPTDPEGVEAYFESTLQHYYDLSVDENFRVHINKRPMSPIAALFIEPIQGEGGILAVEGEFLKNCRRLCDQYRIPMIFDEIQSGMGRTGRFFASEHSGVAGDIYLLSKSLGGGLSKISATLIDRGRYLDEFSLIHSSTFAEDPLSSAVGNKVLDLLERDQLLKMAAEKGAYLKRRLEALKRQYPQAIDCIRGRGLMLGVALAGQQDSGSLIIRQIDASGHLAYFASGYLFHQEKIRVLPTLSDPRVLRLEPSAYISYADLNRVIRAFARLCEVLAKCNAHALLRYIAGDHMANRFPVKDYAQQQRSQSRPTDDSGMKVGFLVHFLDESQLAAIEPSFANFSSREQDRFIRKMMPVAKPCHIASTPITAASGQKINFNLIAVPMTSRHMSEALKNPTDSPALRMVKDAVSLACKIGCEVVGLGQYTSIVSHNGEAIIEPRLTITTGNSFTVAISVQSILEAAHLKGLNPAHTSLSLIGAAGNIGRAYARIIARYFTRINLVGSARPGSLERLEALRAKIVQESYKRLARSKSPAYGPGGIAQRLSKIPLVKELLADDVDAQTAWQVIRFEKWLNPIIPVSTEISTISKSDIIVAVSNSHKRFIRSEHVKQNAIICDVSVPCSTDTDIIQKRKDVMFFTGGIVKLPLGEGIQAPAFPLPPGHVFACMAETMLL